jgi:hypothetical protein
MKRRLRVEKKRFRGCNAGVELLTRWAIEQKKLSTEDSTVSTKLTYAVLPANTRKTIRTVMGNAVRKGTID